MTESNEKRWKVQFKVRWEDESHPFDWIDAPNVRPPDARIVERVGVVYFDGGLYPGKVVDRRTIRDYDERT
jgi:hypothetical protein